MTALQRKRLDDGIEVLRLDRPQARNALDSATLAALEEALRELAADGELRVLVLSTTSERALCAGADVAEELDRDGAVARMEAFARVYTSVEAFPAPTVCVCVGNVVGRTLGMDEVRALGLLHRTAPAAEAEGIAIDLAREIAPHPPDGMRRLKALFRELTGAAAFVEHENAALIEWQRTGDGLPRGGLRSG